jgi:hypothetical protein
MVSDFRNSESPFGLKRFGYGEVGGKSQLHAVLLFVVNESSGKSHSVTSCTAAPEATLRVVYEYEGNMPVVITVYYPAAGRYFRGGGVYEDKILS